MDNVVELWGYRLTASESQFVLESFKAALVTIGASISILVFNSAAKKREQDSELFNELIRLRIKASHDVNRAVSRLIFDYLNLLEEIYYHYDGRLGTFRNDRRTAVKDALTRKNEFLAQLPARENEIRAMIESNRYELGQVGFDAFSGRLKYIQDRAINLWQYYNECIEKWRPDLERVCRDPTDIPLVIAEIVALEGSHEISEILSALEGGFERVIKAKGAQHAFKRPIDIDHYAGMLRIHPLKTTVRHKLSLLLMERPIGSISK